LSRVSGEIERIQGVNNEKVLAAAVNEVVNSDTV
jgi:hypothetical protein